MRNGIAISSAIALMGVLAFAQSAHAATFNITDPGDNTTTNALCSLREALNAHNSHALSADCMATGSSLDYINLAAGTLYQVSTMLYVHGGQLVINGVSGNKPTIAAAPLTNIWGFYVEAGSNQLWLQYVIIKNFHGPAVLADSGAAALVDWCELTANNFTIGNGQSASAVAYPGGYVELYASWVHHNIGSIKGGGLLIYQTGAANALAGTIIEFNHASQYGGGVNVMGDFYCDDGSIIRSNGADLAGGGIFKAPTGTMALPNCTVTGNTAPTDPNIHM
jgi:hypothetical protein